MFHKMISIVKNNIGKIIFLVLILLYQTGFCFSKGKYLTDEFIEKTYTELIDKVIEQDKRARKEMATANGVSSKEIKSMLNKLEPLYEKERQKTREYCIKNNEYCTINISREIHDIWDLDVTIYVTIKYIFDSESLNIFNKIKYIYNGSVDNNDWISFKLIGQKYELSYWSCGNIRPGADGYTIGKKNQVKSIELDIHNFYHWKGYVQMEKLKKDYK